MVTERDIVIELIGGAIVHCGAELDKLRTDDDKLLAKRTIAKHDIVIGYWPDDESGLGYLIIKGATRCSRSCSSPRSPATAGGLTTALRPPSFRASTSRTRRSCNPLKYGDAAIEKAKLAKLFDMLPPAESDALKVKYGLVSVQ